VAFISHYRFSRAQIFQSIDTSSGGETVPDLGGQKCSTKKWFTTVTLIKDLGFAHTINSLEGRQISDNLGTGIADDAVTQKFGGPSPK
jgi:hypothetical protein